MVVDVVLKVVVDVVAVVCSSCLMLNLCFPLLNKLCLHYLVIHVFKSSQRSFYRNKTCNAHENKRVHST